MPRKGWAKVKVKGWVHQKVWLWRRREVVGSLTMGYRMSGYYSACTCCDKMIRLGTHITEVNFPHTSAGWKS